MAYGKAGDWYVNNVEGGGGETWNTVFEGNVTTEEPAEAPWAVIPNTGQITADNIRVTFNGTEYECRKNADGTYGALLDESTETIDWSVYPFNIGYDSGDESMTLITQTTGTYSLKIEEPQSEGSSDLSTAKVTLINETMFGLKLAHIDNTTGIEPEMGQSGEYEVVLYKGKAAGFFTSPSGNLSVTGNITYDDGELFITGDGTITIS